MSEERPVSRSARASRKLAYFALLLLACSAVAHRLGLIETTPLFWLFVIIGALAVLALFFGIAGFSVMWRRGLSGFGAASIGVLAALFLLTPFALVALKVFLEPSSAFVTTEDLADDLDGDPEPDKTRWPGVYSRTYDDGLETVIEHARTLMQKRGWAVSTQVDDGDVVAEPEMITAVATSLVLGLKTDIALLFEQRDDVVHVDMRAGSEFGWHDLGANAALVSSFLADLDQQLAGTNGQ